MIYFTMHFSTLYYSGARKGELLALTWADVDFVGKRLTSTKLNTIVKLQNQRQNHQIESSYCLHLSLIY